MLLEARTVDETYKDIFALLHVEQNGKPSRESVINALQAINNLKDLPDIPFPQPPIYHENDDVLHYINNIVAYIDTIPYNHLHMTFFSTEKYTSIEKIFSVAQEIINSHLPIQCLEATFVALYLTFGIPGITAFPLGFRSRTSTKSYKFPYFILLFYCFIILITLIIFLF